MSTSTALGVVGGAVGFWIGGPQGAQWGYMIGSAVGGYVDPEQVFGPRLQDATVQTSRVGIPIPFGWGVFPTAGNLIWAGPITEHENTERQGKGGPEQVTYTYTRSYAIALCQGMLREDGLYDPISGVLLWKHNKKIVYDARSDGELEDEFNQGGDASVLHTSLAMWIASQRGASTKFTDKVTFYLGSEDQLPDPTMEMHLGAGNVPAYPGLVYAVFDEYDVTETSGAIGQHEAVVGSGMTLDEDVAPTCGELVTYTGGESFPFTTTIELGACIGRVDLHYSPGGIPDKFVIEMDGEVVLDSGYRGLASQQDELDAELTLRGLPLETIQQGTHIDEGDPLPAPFSGLCNGPGSEGCEVGIVSFYKTTETSTATLKVYAPLDETGWQVFVDCPDSDDLPPGWHQVADAPGWIVSDAGELRKDCGTVTTSFTRSPVQLSEIVAGLLNRVGIPPTKYDVSQLTDLVEGVKFANVSGPDLMMAPLMQAYRFDKDERDGKLYFVKRGGDTVATIGPDDLVERDGDAIEWTRVQEAELLRKTSVTYIDPLAVWELNTQTAERRTSTVQAKGESVFEVPLCGTHDFAAQLADIAIKIAWSEFDSCKISLSLAWSWLSCTDPIWVADKAGTLHRVRIEQIEEDSGVLLIEARKDRQSTYTSDVEGVRARPPSVTTPGLIGPTMLAVMDLPVLRDADDKLGVYVAARGILPGWQGAAIYLSTDGGVSGGIVAQAEQASVIGYTTTDLVADVSSEYPSGQTLQVWLPSAPSSVDYATMLRYNNRAALRLDSGEWEVLQYQTVTDDGAGLYTLSGVIRGRYATTPGEASAGSTFVLLDSSVQFVECERWMVGASDMKVKAVSYGTNPDSYAWQDFTFTTPASQTEWPPTNVTAERDGSDTVTVDWAGRPRLGTEVAPYHSQHFLGYRVSYSDGVDTFSYDVLRTTLITGNGTVATLETSEHEYTAAMQTSDFGSVPASLTVTVSGLNAITGAGPASEEVTV